MKSNFHSNQILYVKDIGYARLAIDKPKDIKNTNANNTAQQANQDHVQVAQNDQTNDAVLFDPQMFKIDSDSPFAESQVQVNLSDFNTRKKSMQVLRRQSSDMKSRQQIIVPLKLQQCNAMIYCPEPYLMKKITIIVKSLLQNCRKQVQMSFDITKTIDNMKNMIFSELGEEIGFYSDIKLFTMSPRMEELSIGSKTIWQYQVRDRCKVTLVGKFNFTFGPLPQGALEYFLLSNNNNTVSFVQKKTEAANKTEGTPAIQPVTTVGESTKTQMTPQTNQQAPSNIVQKQYQKPEQVNKKQSPSNKQLKPILQQKFHLQCNVKLRSGIHYWQIKVDKLNQNKELNGLLIGVCLKNQNSTQKNDFVHLWGYDPIRCKKIEHSSQKKQNKNDKDEKQLNGSDQSDEEYGSFAKVGDVIGVLLIIKERKASLVFYKNSTCLEECYQFNLQSYQEQKSKNSIYLCPFVNIMGQIQLTLDSKATPPLDSYRFK